MTEPTTTTDFPDYDDRTVLELETEMILVDLLEGPREVVFRRDYNGGEEIRRYSFGAIASLTGGLALDSGAGLILTADLVAMLKEWANLDPAGLRQRAAL